AAAFRPPLHCSPQPTAIRTLRFTFTPRARRPWSRLVPLLFAVTLFVSASLLFMVQPMVGKMVLPLLGGSPAVWNTCLVFFQAALLLGYLYAHLQSTVFDIRVQIIIHLALLGCAFLFLPIKIPPGLTPPGSANPVPWLMLLLVMTLGLPFVLL